MQSSQSHSSNSFWLTSGGGQMYHLLFFFAVLVHKVNTRCLTCCRECTVCKCHLQNATWLLLKGKTLAKHCSASIDGLTPMVILSMEQSVRHFQKCLSLFPIWFDRFWTLKRSRVAFEVKEKFGFRQRQAKRSNILRHFNANIKINQFLQNLEARYLGNGASYSNSEQTFKSLTKRLLFSWLPLAEDRNSISGPVVEMYVPIGQSQFCQAFKGVVFLGSCLVFLQKVLVHKVNTRWLTCCRECNLCKCHLYDPPWLLLKGQTLAKHWSSSLDGLSPLGFLNVVQS